MLKRRRFWIAIGLTAIFAYMAARGINMRGLRELFHSADPVYLLLTIFLALLAFFVKAVSWYVLMRPVKKGAGLSRLFSSLMIGYGVEDAVGLRLREIYRAIAASEIEFVRFFSVLGTVILGRALEGIVLSLNILIVTGFFVTLAPDNQWSIKLAWATGISFVILLVVLYNIKDEGSQLNSFIKKTLHGLLEDRYEAGLAYYRDFLKGIGAIKKWQSLVTVFLLAVLARGITAGYYWTLGKSLKIALSGPSSFFLTGVASLRILIPPPYSTSSTPQFHDLLGWNLKEIAHMTSVLSHTYSASLSTLSIALTLSVGLLCLFLEAFRRRRRRS